MEKKVKVKESCCACEADMLNEIDELVKDVEEKEDHVKKRREIDAAFKKDGTKKK